MHSLRIDLATSIMITVETNHVCRYPVGSVVSVRVVGSSHVTAFSASGANQWNISVRDPKKDKEDCKVGGT